MSEVNELLAKYKLKLNDIIAWAEKKYQKYITNPYFITLAYLNEVKGIPISELREEEEYIKGSVKKISEITPNDKNIWLNVYNLGIVEEWTFRKCRNCRRIIRRDEDNCPSCGSNDIVESKGRKYLIGDETGVIDLISFGEEIKENEEVSVLVNIRQGRRGKLNAILKKIGSKEKKKEEGMEMAKIKSYLKIYDDGVPIEIFKNFIKQINVNKSVEEIIKEIGGRIENGKVYG